MQKVNLNQETTQKYQSVLIKIAAAIQSGYAFIEIGDCITAVLMALHIIKNPYPMMIFMEIQRIFDKEPIWIIPLFLFYTLLRSVSAIGLWKNRLWGFWLTIFISAATLIMAPFLFPFTTVEMLINGILIMLLFIGFMGNRPILAPE